MRMAFAKIVADGRLVNEVEMVPLIMLPLMGVAIEIGLGMFSFGKKFQQGCPITHALNGAHAAVGVCVTPQPKSDKTRLPAIEFLTTIRNHND